MKKPTATPPPRKPLGKAPRRDDAARERAATYTVDDFDPVLAKATPEGRALLDAKPKEDKP